MKAPSVIGRPLAAASMLAPITTSRQAAMKNSGERATATCRNSGRRISRPKPTRAASPITAGSSA